MMFLFCLSSGHVSGYLNAEVKDCTWMGDHLATPDAA